MPNHDQEIEKRMHPENFEDHDLSVANENTDIEIELEEDE